MDIRSLQYRLERGLREVDLGDMDAVAQACGAYFDLADAIEVTPAAPDAKVDLLLRRVEHDAREGAASCVKGVIEHDWGLINFGLEGVRMTSRDLDAVEDRVVDLANRES